jgi:hypothetical protein
MNTETSKSKKTVMDNGLLTGNWKLTYKLTNRSGVEAFGGRLISSYTDPVTGEGRHLIDPDGRFLPGYFIQHVETIFRPENHVKDRIIIDWLVGHPEVGVDNDHCKLPKGYIKKKNSNPRITLENLDYQSVVDLEEEDYIDKLIGIISLDTGKSAISIEKLRWINNALNLKYRDAKFINNKKIEKQKLRKILKDFVRSSYQKASEFKALLDNLSKAKMNYEIDEMLRLDIISISNGMYFFDQAAIGVSKESVMQRFDNGPDYYAHLLKLLYDQIVIENGSLE